MRSTRSLYYQYMQLPGIIGDHFFRVMDANKDEAIDQEEFIKGLNKLYYG